MNSKDITDIENKLGYTFKDKNLLVVAFTHSSYTNEHGGENNEKLEFLGDSILDFVIAEKLFFMRLNEGVMTRRRAAVVSREPLCHAVEDMNILKYYRVGRGIDAQQLSVKFKSNLFETIVAALYLDCGMRACKKFILAHLRFDFDDVDYKSRLQEILQAHGKQAKYFDLQVSEHPPMFSATVYVDGNLVGEGKGRQKREAQKNAALAALHSRFVTSLKKK